MKIEVQYFEPPSPVSNKNQRGGGSIDRVVYNILNTLPLQLKIGGWEGEWGRCFTAIITVAAIISWTTSLIAIENQRDAHDQWGIFKYFAAIITEP